MTFFFNIGLANNVLQVVLALLKLLIIELINLVYLKHLLVAL